MPAVPPSYDQAMSTGGQAPMYPPLPSEKGGPPPANYQSPPPPAGYPTQPPPATTTVVTQVQYVQAPQFGYRPMKMTCPHCQASITTKTDEESSAMAWIICAACCLFGFWPCSCIPFCMDSLKTVSPFLPYLYYNNLQLETVNSNFDNLSLVRSFL